MMAYELKNIAILNAKGVDYRSILWGISKGETVNRLTDGKKVVSRFRGKLMKMIKKCW